MQVARALAGLAARGDRSDEARPVTHRVRLGTRETLDLFLRTATAAGYRPAREPREATDGSWSAEVGCRLRALPEEIEPAVSKIATLAEALGGRYEGWDTHLVGGGATDAKDHENDPPQGE